MGQYRLIADPHAIDPTQVQAWISRFNSLPGAQVSVAPVATALTLLWLVVIAWLPSVPANARETGVVGCWGKEVKDPRKSHVDICFGPDGRLTGDYMETGGEGGDIAGFWRLHGSSLTIDDKGDIKQVCVIRFESGGRRFTLSHCSHQGMWNRCADHDDIMSCFKS